VLLHGEPPPTSAEPRDTLLAALAEHIAAGHDAAPAVQGRVPGAGTAVVPRELQVQRADAIVPGASRFPHARGLPSACDRKAA
jgi:hypothetical protein